MAEALDWLQFVLAPQMINGMRRSAMAVILMALGLTIIFGLLDVHQHGARRVLRDRRLSRR